MFTANLLLFGPNQQYKVRTQPFIMITGFSLLFLIGALSLGITASSTSLILRCSRQFKLGGRERELHHTHQTAISRLGGIGLALGSIASALAIILGGFVHADALDECMKILILSAAMFALGLWDDLRTIGAKRKLMGQVIIASAAYFSGIGIHIVSVPFGHEAMDLGLWAWPVTVLWLVAMTNLINLIDGVDGLAGGISLMLMILLAGLGTTGCGVSIMASGMIGALLGFLWFNFPPARIYMGDGGAYFLGFSIGCLTIVSSQKGTIFAALIAPLFVLALPILDTSLAIVRRGMQGLPLFRPDRKHIHHRMLDLGLSRRSVVLGAYVFTAFFLLLGFGVFWTHGEQLPILVGFGTLFILLAAGKLSFSREWLGVGRVLGNSLSARAEIQYALAQTRWRILEGARCRDLDSHCEDTILIGRKIGFSSVSIKLADSEKKWQQTPADNGRACWTFRQSLPGQNDSYIEITAVANIEHSAKIISLSESPILDKHTFEILGDLLAEGWAKAMAQWKKKSDLSPHP